MEVVAGTRGTDRDALPDADRAAVDMAPGPRGAHQAGHRVAGGGRHRVPHHGVAAAAAGHQRAGRRPHRGAVHLGAQPARPAGDPGARRQPVRRGAGHPDPAVPGGRHPAARPVRAGRLASTAASSARSSCPSCSASSRAPSGCCSGSTRTSRTTARSCGRSRAAGRMSSTPTPRASSSSSSTACPTTCCRTRCAPDGCR